MPSPESVTTKGLVDNLLKQICAECDTEFPSVSRYTEHLVKPRSRNPRCEKLVTKKLYRPVIQSKVPF